MRIYKHGAIIRLVGRFEYEGQPADPPGVYAHIKPPGRPWEILEATTSQILTHEGPGHYKLELKTHDSKSPGLWSYAWGYSETPGVIVYMPPISFMIRQPDPEIP